jgi:hypothetical protein
MHVYVPFGGADGRGEDVGREVREDEEVGKIDEHDWRVRSGLRCEEGEKWAVRLTENDSCEEEKHSRLPAPGDEG